MQGKAVGLDRTTFYRWVNDKTKNNIKFDLGLLIKSLFLVYIRYGNIIINQCEILFLYFFKSLLILLLFIPIF